MTPSGFFWSPIMAAISVVDFLQLLQSFLCSSRMAAIILWSSTMIAIIFVKFYNGCNYDSGASQWQ